MQLLGTKNHATSWYKKTMQPLGTKKSRNLSGQKSCKCLGQKNHSTSWDKKIMQPLRTKKNHATSRDNTITRPLGTTKKSWNHSGQKKSRNLLGQKKSCNLSGQIVSKLVEKAPNCTKCHQVFPNGSK